MIAFCYGTREKKNLSVSDRSILQAAACLPHATSDVSGVFMPAHRSVIAHSSSCSSYLSFFLFFFTCNFIWIISLQLLEVCYLPTYETSLCLSAIDDAITVQQTSINADSPVFCEMLICKSKYIWYVPKNTQILWKYRCMSLEHKHQYHILKKCGFVFCIVFCICIVCSQISHNIKTSHKFNSWRLHPAA